jgi:prephenate dehydrogenase
MPFKQKIVIIGVGLLGGSLALALKKKRNIQLVGWNHRFSSRKKASRILDVAPTFEKAIEGADIILLCSHSGSISKVLKKITTHLTPKTLVMDVSSVKGEVVKEGNRLSGTANYFVPCHPMAGKEKSGIAFADGDLYKKKFVFITPLNRTPEKLLQKAVLFWKEIGAVPLILNATQHDQNVALTSHLPHLLAAAYMGVYEKFQKRAPSIHQAVGSGFKDFTRIAGSNPVMWTDIVEMNAPEIRHFLRQYVQTLNFLKRNLRKGRRSYWLSFFKKAHAAREKLT